MLNFYHFRQIRCIPIQTLIITVVMNKLNGSLIDRELGFSACSLIACVAGVIGEGEGERGRREKMRGIGERGEGTV